MAWVLFETQSPRASPASPAPATASHGAVAGRPRAASSSVAAAETPHAPVARNGFPEIVRGEFRIVLGLVGGHLSWLTGAAPGNGKPTPGAILFHDGLHGRPAHVDLAAVAEGRPDDRLRSNLRLKDRGNRLALARQAALDPAKWACSWRRHLHHGEPDLATVVDQLAPQRMAEPLDCCLAAR